MSSGRSLDQRVEVETPEQVVITYTVAGIGSRAAAAIIDTLILAGITLVTVLLISRAAAVARGLTGLAAGGAWLFALYILFQFALVWGYYVLFEALRDGQTPGKRYLGLRVVQDGGYSISLSASVVRNLLRIVDLQPAFTYGVGIVSAAFSSSGKRLGDMVAGTFVVQERVTHVVVPAATPAGAGTPGAAPVVTAVLSDEEYALLERFLARRQSLDRLRRAQFGEQLAERFRAHLEPGAPERALAELYARERSVRSRGIAARSDTGAAREQHAIVAQGSERWLAFAGLLENVRRRGLRSLSEEEVSEFVAAYREVATDLARLRTASRGRDADSVYYLSRLVAAGHNLFYRQRHIPLEEAFRYLAFEVPREVRRSWRPILAAAALFFVPAGIAWTAVVMHPPAAHEFIPPAMIDRAEEGQRRAEEGTGYIDDPELFRPVMATAIIANNVQVTFTVFAMGVTAGLGTVFMLLFNGIHIGGFMGLYQSLDILPLLVAFVAPHGVLELTAIAIAGGGGLLLASAILFPGALTRSEALVVQGRRAIRLITCSTLMLIVAGLIEGLISPIPDWPLAWKLGVGAATGVIFVLYLSSGVGRRVVSRPGEEYAYAEIEA
ncbi:MAG TPA: stage II sporulation protein M, partial [Gemmatimonadaceae bacterium]|nr:stage II sporulation protein M [Gemmatimonadaceae bacterium]